MKNENRLGDELKSQKIRQVVAGVFQIEHPAPKSYMNGQFKEVDRAFWSQNAAHSSPLGFSHVWDN
jgi:predicted NUDIX family NTP pyrophosphohydrolase